MYNHFKNFIFMAHQFYFKKKVLHTFKLIYTVNDSFLIKKYITFFGFTLNKSVKIKKIELKLKKQNHDFLTPEIENIANPGFLSKIGQFPPKSTIILK